MSSAPILADVSDTRAPLEVRPVSGTKERRIFLKFPWRIYHDDPMWVPPILSDLAKRIDPEHNEIFQHGEVALFIAWRGRSPVGTIAAAVDHDANQHREAQVGVFGFFECVDDYAVAKALLDTAVDWHQAHGTDEIRGPQSFGNSDTPGVLIEGRETPSGLLMGWSPPYYQGFMERYGLEKYHDALAYRITLADYTNGDGKFCAPARLQRIMDYAQERYGDRFRIRQGNLEDWDNEMEIARGIYNRSLATLRDFTPMNREEWWRMAASIRPLLDQDLVLFVEVDGEAVAFGLGLVDISQALWHCNGLRTPWDYAKLWWYSRKLPGVSFKIMAMLPEYSGLGLGCAVYVRIAEESFRKGYSWMDMSLTGDDNPMTNKMAAWVGAHIDKRYRLYTIKTK